MGTKVEQNKDVGFDCHRADDSFYLAIAVLQERLSKMAEEDREALYELVKILWCSTDEDEKQEAKIAINEIMDQDVSKFQLMEDPRSEMQSCEKWIVYVSERIRTARKAAGLTQIQLAEVADLTQSHISRIERGEHSPTRKTIEKIAAAVSKPVVFFDPSAENEEEDDDD
jgi:ribosome-binding protein aMBF1 (putative translation factor)